MDLQLFQDLAPAEREEMLDAQADDVTEENYLQPYTNAEKAQRREEYVALSLEMKQITEEEDEMKQQVYGHRSCQPQARRRVCERQALPNYRPRRKSCWPL